MFENKINDNKYCYVDENSGKLEIELYEEHIYFNIPFLDPEFTLYQAEKIAKKIMDFVNSKKQ